MGRIGKIRLGKTTLDNRIIWILSAFIIVFLIFGGVITLMCMALPLPYDRLSDRMFFVVNTYIVQFLPLLLTALLYFALVPKNRFILKKLNPANERNTGRKFCAGLLAGFLMNSACAAAALIHGDIRLSLAFDFTDLPFYLAAFSFVCVQSATEEIMCRGFLYERLSIHYPRLLAMVLSGIVFSMMHAANNGITSAALFYLFLCGVSFAAADWAAGSIWTPIGIHTAWNFTQNLIYGLPNSGVVSESSVFRAEAVNGNINLIYDPVFGVEGAVPALIAMIVLTAACVYMCRQADRIKELVLSYENEMDEPEVLI